MGINIMLFGTGFIIVVVVVVVVLLARVNNELYCLRFDVLRLLGDISMEIRSLRTEVECMRRIAGNMEGGK